MVEESRVDPQADLPLIAGAEYIARAEAQTIEAFAHDTQIGFASFGKAYRAGEPDEEALAHLFFQHANVLANARLG
ncbi:hypothetical protein AcidC75_19800 [Acidisoma sp. C75]